MNEIAYNSNIHETWNFEKEVTVRMNAYKIGRRLKKLRGKKTREEVAEANGISLSALSMYECGLRIPRDEIKIKLARYYDKTIEEIFFAR